MPVDHLAVHLALRARALLASVCTTGSISLSATTAGYARASGSFLTDGFAPGMELVATGFGTAANNAAKVITAVTATLVTVSGGCTAEAAGAGRTLAVGCPSRVAYPNVAFTPASGSPYVEEDYAPGTSDLESNVATGGVVRDAGVYVLRLYGPANVGAMALTALADAILAQFAKGSTLAAGSDTVRIGGTPGPRRGAMRADTPGWSVVVVTIPWWMYTTNQ